MVYFVSFALGVIATAASTLALAQSQDLVPIITYDETHPLVEQFNPYPMVRVYSTGDVIVYRGTGMKNPGEYSLTLTGEELEQIKLLAQSVNVVQIDEAALTVAAFAVNNLIISSDPTTSMFEFNRIAGGNVLSAGDGSTTDAMQTVELDDVSMTASAVPGSDSLASLSELHVQLINLYSKAGQ